MQAHVQNTEYRDVPVAALIESPSNPRKRFDESSLSELAASFKTEGIIAPLLVREVDERNYEVIAGARRLRAANLRDSKVFPFASSNSAMLWQSKRNGWETLDARTFTRWKRHSGSNRFWNSENRTTSLISRLVLAKARRTSMVV